MLRAFLRRQVFLILGLGLVLVGLGLFIAAARQASSPADFGWFAYTPLDGGLAVGGDFVIVSQLHLVASLVVGLGLLLAAFGVGYRLGRRHEPRHGR